MILTSPLPAATGPAVTRPYSTRGFRLANAASAAVARWTAAGKDVRYVLATRGEAGIDSMAPEQAGPLRTAEQVAAAAAVGVSTVEFLDHPDGLIVNGIGLRRDLAAAVRRHRPEVLIGSNFQDRWGEAGPARRPSTPTRSYETAAGRWATCWVRSSRSPSS